MLINSYIPDEGPGNHMSADDVNDLYGSDSTAGGGSTGWGSSDLSNFDLPTDPILDNLDNLDGIDDLGDPYTDLGSYDGYDETGWGGTNNDGIYDTDNNPSGGYGESGSGSGGYGGEDNPEGGTGGGDNGGVGGNTGDGGGGGGGDDETSGDVYNPSGGPEAPIAQQMWENEGWLGDTTQSLFDGTYRADMPMFDPYSQVGTLADAGAGIGMYDVPDQLDYYSRFMNANPAWESMAKEGESMMLERLGQYGGSASAGFSGQQAAGLGRYWSDQVADRWSQASPYANAQWSADTGRNITDWQRQWQTTETDYGNAWNTARQNYGTDLNAYNAPYNFSTSMVPNFWGQAPVQQQTGTTGGGSDFGGLIGGVVGGVGGWYLGGPAGAAAGWQMGSNLGYEYL